MFFVVGKQKTPRWEFFVVARSRLFLRLLEHNVLAESLAVFLELDFLFYGLAVLAGRVDFASFLIS